MLMRLLTFCILVATENSFAQEKCAKPRSVDEMARLLRFENLRTHGVHGHGTRDGDLDGNHYREPPLDADVASDRIVPRMGFRSRSTPAIGIELTRPESERYAAVDILEEISKTSIERTAMRGGQHAGANKASSARRSSPT